MFRDPKECIPNAMEYCPWWWIWAGEDSKSHCRKPWYHLWKAESCKAWPHPQISHPIFPVLWMRYHSAIQLYYMAQLMLPEGNFLAGPDLILWTFKSKKVSQAGDRKKKWEGFEIWERFSTFCCLWRWPCKKECRWVLRAGSHPSLQMAREWRL